LFARGSLCIHAHISLLRARSWFPAGQKLAGGGRAHERVDQAWRQDATIVSQENLRPWHQRRREP